MKARDVLIGQMAALVLLTALAAYPTLTRAAGSLTPPGAPAPTMKTLQEIEPRTLISFLPYTIDTPGSYYLSTNLSVTTGDGITISASGVMLDLNGFTISSTAASATGFGILINSSSRDVSIRNGSIEGGVTNNSSGSIFSGPGFAWGIYGYNAGNVRVFNVSVSGVLSDGIWLDTNTKSKSVVHGCSVDTAGSFGIHAGVVESCSANNCGDRAIDGGSVSDSYGKSYGYGINGQLVINSTGYSLAGMGISASEAENCFGYTYTTSSYGIYGDNLNNCYGYGGASGVHAAQTARGCYGSSSHGNGVSARTADNCVGYTYASGTSNAPYAGVSATVANNCYGSGFATSSYTYGIDAGTANNCRGYGYYGVGCNVYPGTAENCYGTSTYGYGIYAYAALNCYGKSTNSDGIYATTANSCYGESLNGGGMVANTANNCVAGSQTGGWGLLCWGTANNCVGYVSSNNSANGVGIAAGCANGCSGSSAAGDGRGISGGVVANSFGWCLSSSTLGTGIDAGDIAIGSSGVCDGASGIGLSAYIGQSCTGSGTTPLSVTHPSNCFIH